MFVPYETQPIPVINDLNGARRLLRETCKTGLPGFVMHLSGVELNTEKPAAPVLNMFRSTLRNQGFRTIVASAPIKATSETDLPLHVAQTRFWHDPVEGMMLKLMISGTENARLFRPTEAFWQQWHHSLEFESLAHLVREGEVDDTYLNPVMYEAALQAPAILGFPTAGAAALAYQFEAESEHRDFLFIDAYKLF